MDPVVSLKRALEVDLKLCIFCQKRNKPKDDVNCWGNLTNCGGMTCDGLASRLGGVEILTPSRFMLQKPGISSGSYGPVGSKASFFFHSMTLKMSEQIIEAAQFNYKLRVRLAGVCDLITAEAKYNLPCLSAFKRNAGKAKLETKESDLGMIWLCEELEYAVDKGYVITLNDACAWTRYMVRAERAEIELPRSFISRR